MENENASPPRWRPRFSLVTGLLLVTIAGMGIVIAQLWREVGPLRSELRGLRTELGFLNIDDPTKACAIQLQTSEPRHWKWRVYLPPEGKYRFCFYSGRLPSPKQFVGKAWFNQVENGGVGSGTSGTMDGGKFTLEATLKKDGGQWMLQTKGTGGRGGNGGTIAQPSGDWLSDVESFSGASSVHLRNQTVFEPGEPIMLLKHLKPIITKFPGGYSSRDPDGEADGFVMWIDQVTPPPPPPPSTQANP